MSRCLEPRDEAELRDAVAGALADRQTLAIEGRGSKPGLGRPVIADRTLTLRGLSGITYYEPGELVLEAEAGTPMAEIEACLAEHDQQLAFEPPDLGPFYGQAAGQGSLGGAVACNLSGPRRPFAGAARDHVLGIRAVSGRGEVFASGGRVVKNVTGYDMAKLLTGSYGTLAVLSRVIVKVLPRSETIRTALFFGDDAACGLEILAQAAAGSWDISGAAFIPARAAARSGVDFVAASGGVTAIRLEGSRDGAAERTRALRDALAGGGEHEELHTHRSRMLWSELGSGALLPKAGAGGDMVWRISLPPAACVQAMREIAGAGGGEVLTDWAGSLVWLAVPSPGALEPAQTAARKLRSIVEALGGFATLMRAPEALHADIPVFHPEAPAVAALTRRVKENFDPLGVLNPGRMVAGL